MDINDVISRAKDKDCVIRDAEAKDGAETLKVAKSAFPNTQWKYPANKTHYTNLTKSKGNLACIVIEKKAVSSVICFINIEAVIFTSRILEF